MDFENEILTADQKEQIYQKMLVPLKTKISQIILYDTEAALNFLQKYNEIVRNEKKLGMNIINKVADLEFEIQLYEKSQGKEKAFEERSKAVLQNIENLKSESIQLELSEFESKVAELKKENFQNYRFEDREKIEGQIHDLQAILIMRQVSNGKTTEELKQDIDEQDKIGLSLWINGQINRLIKEQDLRLQTIGKKISNIVMTDKDAVLNVDVWKLLDSAIKGKKIETQEQERQKTEMTIASQKKKRGTIVDKILRFFSNDPTLPLQNAPTLPLQIEDLGKISINWWGEYMPKILLQDLEEFRLEAEGIKTNSRYLPDSRLPIYRLFKIITEIRQKKLYVEKYELFNENGGKIHVQIEENYGFYSRHSLESVTVKMKAEEFEKEETKNVRNHQKMQILNETLALVRIIDLTFNTNFRQQLLNEIKEAYIDKTRALTMMTIYNQLERSWYNMRKEYEATKIDFGATEQMKREKFYKKYSFQEGIKGETKDIDKNQIKEKNKKNKSTDNNINCIEPVGEEYGGK